MRVLVVALALSLAWWARGQTPSNGSDDAELKAVEHQWVNAYYRGDTETLDRIEADEFTVIADGEKEETKAEQMAGVRARGPAEPAPATLIQEQQVRRYGDVVLITGLSKTTPGDIRFTEVWVKRNGQWKVVHLNYVTAK